MKRGEVKAEVKWWSEEKEGMGEIRKMRRVEERRKKRKSAGKREGRERFQ